MQEKLRAFVSQFEFLTPDEVDTIVNNTVLKQTKKGDFLLKEGEIATSCYAVIEGCVRVYHIKDGEEKTSAFYTEGEAVNEFSSYTGNKPSKFYVECAEDCILTVGNESLIEEMMKKVPRLQEFIQVEVEKNAGRLQEQMALFISSTPEERFHQLLETKPSLFNRVPQHQIASYLGIKPESLSRLKKRVYS